MSTLNVIVTRASIVRRLRIIFTGFRIIVKLYPQLMLFDFILTTFTSDNNEPQSSAAAEVALSSPDVSPAG